MNPLMLTFLAEFVMFVLAELSKMYLPLILLAYMYNKGMFF